MSEAHLISAGFGIAAAQQKVGQDHGHDGPPPPICSSPTTSGIP